ncbi:MAG: TIGR03618 family F420-dependent PPOX class oxidoreductase [Streptomycetaceae bacterium]|nr:TIGR03618 family F420-dependent PPOX class oxidoreductase [Streptomycetaceae bacterium]
MSDTNSGPAPRPLTDAEAVELLGAHQFGVLATVKRSGHPVLSTVLYRWDPADRVIRISTTSDRLKTKHIRNNPLVALHVSGPDVWSFATAEGEAEIIADPESGPDRVLITLTVARLYGTALDIT